MVQEAREQDSIMRAKEFLREGFQKSLGSLSDAVIRTIPGMHVIPELQNQDAYKQYRFGLALAASGAGSPRAADETPWGENMAVGTYTIGDEEILKAALQAYGTTSKMITTKGSHEPRDTNTISPVAAKKKNRYGV